MIKTATVVMEYICFCAEFFKSVVLEESLGTWGKGHSHIQADETVLRGVKHQDEEERRGRKRKKPQWPAGWCEVNAEGHTTRVCASNLIPEGIGRRKEELIPPIVEAVSERAKVVSDGLRTYFCLPKLVPSIKQGVVVHKEFVNEKGEHTTNMERTWGVIKDYLEEWWPRNWKKGIEQVLERWVHLSVMMYNASLSEIGPFCMLWRAISMSDKDLDVMLESAVESS